jgi:hypothetical protein
MLAARFLIGALALLAASCGLVGLGSAKALTDGCYYLGGRPVFRIAGDRGRVLIPSDVTDFHVRTSRTIFGRAEATFEPAFLFDGGADPAPTRAAAWHDRRAYTCPDESGNRGPHPDHELGSVGSRRCGAGGGLLGEVAAYERDNRSRDSARRESGTARYVAACPMRNGIDWRLS